MKRCPEGFTAALLLKEISLHNDHTRNTPIGGGGGLQWPDAGCDRLQNYNAPNRPQFKLEALGAVEGLLV